MISILIIIHNIFFENENKAEIKVLNNRRKLEITYLCKERARLQSAKRRKVTARLIFATSIIVYFLTWYFHFSGLIRSQSIDGTAVFWGLFFSFALFSITINWWFCQPAMFIVPVIALIIHIFAIAIYNPYYSNSINIYTELVWLVLAIVIPGIIGFIIGKIADKRFK